MIMFHANVHFVFGAHASTVFNGGRRMGLRANPVVNLLAERIGTRPGRPFAGYAEDFYGRVPLSNLNEELVRHWVQNWQRYGNGMKLFSWNVLGIPTITEY